MAETKQSEKVIQALIGYLKKEAGAGRLSPAPIEQLLLSIGDTNSAKEIMGLRADAEKAKLGASIRKNAPPEAPPEPVDVKMAKQLRGLGWSPKEIAQMSPDQAAQLLAEGTAEAEKAAQAAKEQKWNQPILDKLRGAAKSAQEEVEAGPVLAGSSRRMRWSGLSELGKRRAIGKMAAEQEAAGRAVPAAAKSLGTIGTMEEAPAMLAPLVKKFPALEGFLSKGNIAGLIGFMLLNKLGGLASGALQGREQAKALSMMAGARTTEDVLTDQENARAEQERAARGGDMSVDPRVMALLHQMSLPQMTPHETYIGPSPLMAGYQ